MIHPVSKAGWAFGTLDVPKARKRAAEHKAKIAEIDAKLAQGRPHQPDRGAAGNRQGATEAVRSQIINEIAVVTVLPGRRGVRGFNPDFIDIAWKTDLEL